MAARLHLSDDRGNVVVEFALVLPIFLMLLMGLVDYGLAAREKSTMEAAARAGLQAVLQEPSNTAGAQAAAEAMLADTGADVTVSTECLCPDGSAILCTNVCAVGNRRQVVSVDVSQEYRLLVPWPGLKDPLPLAAKARARVR